MLQRVRGRRKALGSDRADVCGRLADEADGEPRAMESCTVGVPRDVHTLEMHAAPRSRVTAHVAVLCFMASEELNLAPHAYQASRDVGEVPAAGRFTQPDLCAQANRPASKSTTARTNSRGASRARKCPASFTMRMREPGMAR